MALAAFMSICIQAEAQDDWANIGRYLFLEDIR